MAKNSPKDVSHALFFGFGLIFDLFVIIGALFKEAFGSNK